MKTKCDLKHAVVIGVFAVLLYIVCLLWRFTMTDISVAQFHLLALKTMFPGFNGYDTMSIVWGGALSFLYGFVASTIFHSLHGSCACSMKK